MKLSSSKNAVRGIALVTALFMLMSATGCNIRNYSVNSEKKLIESTEDETVWVEDGVTESQYSDSSNVYNSTASSGSLSSAGGSSSSSGGGSSATEEKDLKLNLSRMTLDSENGYALKVSDYIKDTDVQLPYYLFGNSFKIDNGESTMWAWHLDPDTVKKSNAYYNLGSSEVVIYGDLREWGYNFFMDSDSTSGNGVRKGGGGFDITPTSRRLALELLKIEIFDLYSVDITSPFESCPGHYFWQHYSCEWGADSIGSEIGECISSTQSHIAFSRGAARQYGLPWFTQFSFWGQGSYINDYTGLQIWGSHSSTDGGHSPSLYKRSFLATYMGGASHFYPEAGIDINFTSNITSEGVYELSPVGEMTKQADKFASENEVGINYIPFGIVLDYYHGMYTGNTDISKMRAFQTFPYEDGDYMIWKLLDMFFPNSWQMTHSTNEEKYHVNGPYGDTCDILLQNASQEVLNSYPALILAGNIELSDTEIKRYKAYVKQGGTLVLNTAYLDYFPEYKELYNGEKRHDISVNGGRVIVFGGDYELTELDGILNDLIKEYIPFEFSDEVEYMINVKNGSLIVTVINNNGHQYAEQLGGYKIDYSKTVDLTVKYTGNLKVKAVNELWYGDTLPTGSEVTVTLVPGDAKVIEFYFG